MTGQAELTERQLRSLSGDGYLLVPSVLPGGVADGLARRLDALVGATVTGTLNYSPVPRLAVTTGITSGAASCRAGAR